MGEVEICHWCQQQNATQQHQSLKRMNTSHFRDANIWRDTNISGNTGSRWDINNSRTRATAEKQIEALCHSRGDANARIRTDIKNSRTSASSELKQKHWVIKLEVMSAISGCQQQKKQQLYCSKNTRRERASTTAGSQQQQKHQEITETPTTAW